MQAVVVYASGDPAQLVYTEVPKPKARPGWSLVQIHGFGINHSEIFTRQGLSPTVKFPRILGIECVGIVAETSDPTRLPVGQKAISIMGEMGRAFDGSYAEYALIPNGQIYPVETSLPWELLAAVPETYYTAYGSLQNLRIREKDTVLVRGATSGVGMAFAKLVRAKFPNILMDGTSRNMGKADALQAGGFSHAVMDRDGVLQTVRRYDKILELIGPATIKDSFRHLRRGGIVCNTGQLGGKWHLEEFDPIIDLAEDGYLTSFYSGNVSETQLNEMLHEIEKNHIDVRPEKVFHLHELPQAHAWLEQSQGLGKAVVVLQGERDAQ